jgi:hypothetical protein
MALMDEIARRYLLLGLRLERRVPGFVDSYVGPPELAEVVASEAPVAPRALHDEALQLQELAAELPADEASDQRRRDWFLAQLRAISALARQAAGEELRYLDLVEQLFDVSVALIPEDRFAAARAALDGLLPRGGSLRERYRSWSDRLAVAPERVVPAMRASAARFRRAAERDLPVPRPESIEWGEVRDEPWGADARFQGNGVTRIRINLDLPHTVASIPYLASHEGYPGHHLEHITKEQTLVRRAGLGEATLRTINTPESLLAEGLADVAREVVMSDLELGAEMRLVARDAGLDDAAVELAAGAAGIGRAMLELLAATGNAAIMRYEQEVPLEQVRDYLLETTVERPEMIDHLMRVLADPLGGTYPFTYYEGARVIRAWLEVQGQTTGFSRLLGEQHTPSRLVAEARSTDAG